MNINTCSKASAAGRATNRIQNHMVTARATSTYTRKPLFEGVSGVMPTLLALAKKHACVARVVQEQAHV